MNKKNNEEDRYPGKAGCQDDTVQAPECGGDTYGARAGNCFRISHASYISTPIGDFKAMPMIMVKTKKRIIQAHWLSISKPMKPN